MYFRLSKSILKSNFLKSTFWIFKLIYFFMRCSVWTHIISQGTVTCWEKALHGNQNTAEQRKEIKTITIEFPSTFKNYSFEKIKMKTPKLMDFAAAVGYTSMSCWCWSIAEMAQRPVFYIIKAAAARHVCLNSYTLKKEKNSKGHIKVFVCV